MYTQWAGQHQDAADLGQTINQWAGSDPIAWRDIAARGISYEKKIPLYASKPEGMSESHWRKLAAEAQSMRRALQKHFREFWQMKTHSSSNALQTAFMSGL